MSFQIRTVGFFGSLALGNLSLPCLGMAAYVSRDMITWYRID